MTRALVVIVAMVLTPMVVPSQTKASKLTVLPAFSAAFTNRDAAAVAALYAEDGVLLPPDEPAVSGRAAIKVWYQQLFASGVPAPTLESVRAVDEGPIAFETIVYAPGPPASNARPAGWKVQRFMWTLRQSNAGWRIDSHMMNSDRPALPCK